MRAMRDARIGAALAVVLIGGCAGPRMRPGEPARGVDADRVLAAHNAWADGIPHLVASGRVRLSFPKGDGSKNREKHDIDANVLLEKPRCFLLRGHVFGKELFKLGTNAERYWLYVRPIGRIVFGTHGGVGERRMVLHPGRVMEALGCYRIDPAPDGRLRLDAFGAHCVLTEERHGEGAGWMPVRRVWFDRTTNRPKRIDLFDAAGRLVMMAELLRYKRVDDVDVCVAYRVRLYGGGEEADIVLRLDRVRLDVPKPGVFEYRKPPGAEEEDLDKTFVGREGRTPERGSQR